MTFIFHNSKNNIDQIPTGYFIGGACTESEYICGGWYITSDSNFYFFSLEKDNYLKGVGKGKVIKYEDSVMYFVFDQDFNIPNRNVLKYKAENLYPNDSTFFDIKISLPKGHKFIYPLLVTYNDKYIGSADDSGILKVKLSNSQIKNFGILEITGRDLEPYPLDVFIQPNTSYHKITASIPGMDAAFCRVFGNRVSNASSKFEANFLITTNPNLRRQWYLRAATKSDAVKSLQFAKVNQPYLTNVIDSIIETMQNK